jgi:hypothetical protein
VSEYPKIATVVSCGAQKQDLNDGETAPARELYTSSVHTCKDRYGRHSARYYIASAKFGLVPATAELPEYDMHLDDRTEGSQVTWGWEVVEDLREAVELRKFDAVVLIANEQYAERIVSPARSLPLRVPLYTPWQAHDHITAVGKGMAWCNDEDHWPVNLGALDEDVLGEPRNGDVEVTLSRWSECR